MSLTACQIYILQFYSDFNQKKKEYAFILKKSVCLTTYWQKMRVIMLFSGFMFLLTWPAIQAQAGLIRDSELETGFTELTRDIAAEAGFADGITFRIVINPSYNAFVRGGDTVYLHSGLLLTAKSAEEIYGVIAHEIGHLAAGHVPLRSEVEKQASLANALTAVASAAAVASGSVDAAIGVAIGGTDRSKRLYYQKSRADESVADEWAIRLLNSQNVTTEGLAGFMRRMAAQRALPESRQSEYYLSHPGAKDRLAAFTDNIAQHGHELGHLPAEKQALMGRLVTKLRAYVLSPVNILKTPVDIDWPEYQPDQSHADYAIAIAHYRRGTLTQALTGIEQLTAAYPADAWFSEFHGDILYSDAQLQKSAQAYEKAISMAPDAALMKLSLARVLIAQNDSRVLEQAITELEALIEAEPKWAFIRRQLGIAYGRNNQLGQADLALAEEALLIGDTPTAIRLARRSLSHADLPQDVSARARDILFELNAPLPVN